MGNKMRGVELSARFALPPNSFSYCGTPAFRRAFAAYLREKSPANASKLQRALSKFRAHYSYLELIAKANGKKPFDLEVAEALWIGSPLLLRVERREIAKIITNEFSGRGLLSKEKAAKLAEGIPKGALPHHSFHVLYLHTITGIVPPSLRTADMCRISWGKVVSVKGGRAVVDSQKLARKNGKLALVPCRKTVRATCAGIELVPDIRKGDIVASHWGFAVMKLSKRQKANLEKYTNRNLSSLASE
ncbi:MAG: DUF6390 family protein [Candidatus Micrarchaeia archaeon]